MLTISALIVLLCLIGSTAGFPLDNSSIDLKIERTDVNKIFRRQCIWSEAKDDWVCDYWLPSLSQIIDRMRDDASGGLADVDHSIVFYTGLNIPQDEMCSVIEHWASAQKLTYYWYETCQSWAWLERQERWVDTKDFADRVTPHGLFGDWPIDTWMSCQFQALALAAISPDVYLLMNAGERWADESSWGRWQSCRMRRNDELTLFRGIRVLGAHSQSVCQTNLARRPRSSACEAIQTMGEGQCRN